jgi:potassium-dependent mechanosensitive channel
VPFPIRLAWLLLLLVIGAVPVLIPAWAQTTAAPQRPFGQLVELWTRQLDRIATRAGQADLLPVEIDTLREQAADVRTAAVAAGALARNDLADTRKLLAPLEVKPATDSVPEAQAVKADRERLTEQATLIESRVRQSEVITARADQVIERLTKLRGEVMLRTLLRRDSSPLSREVWSRLGPQSDAAVAAISTALAAWGRDGPGGLRVETGDLAALAAWAILTVVLWAGARFLRRRFGRGDAAEPGQRDRTLAAAIDGVGLVLVPILAVWLIGKLLLATSPPPPIDVLLTELIIRVTTFMLVVGLTATALSPHRPAWRVLPFTNDSADMLSFALRRLMAVALTVDFIYVALTHSGVESDALRAVGALVLASVVALLTLPVLGNRCWHAIQPEGAAERPAMIGGTWWSIARAFMSVAILSSIPFALLGYTTLAAQLHNAIYTTCLLVAVAVLLHRLLGDLLEEAAAPDTPSGKWVRHRFGLAPDAKLLGHHFVLLLIDLGLVLLLAIAIPAAWGIDTDAILTAAGHLIRGVQVGGITISLGNVALAILAFIVCILLARLIRRIVRDRVLPTVDAPLALRQSIDAGLNYVGVIIALLIGIGTLGIDFTNLAIVLGALSVGIGLGLQNIANNVISGVFLLVERPIKAGDWVSVNGHEGFVRRINIRATEIETFQRTHVLVPNSIFLQNPVVNRTYSDTSSRIEIKLTVALATDPTALETLLREAALGHPRVLRVPSPIVRFVAVTPTGLDFELFVFVARLEDRLVVGNDLNKAILDKLIEQKIIDPEPIPKLRVIGLEDLPSADRQSQPGQPQPGQSQPRQSQPTGPRDAAASS